MSKFGNFYKPGQVNYVEVAPAYARAFKEPPWREVSRCVDTEVPQRCPGGLSAVAIGVTCVTCGQMPDQPAHEEVELVRRFTRLGEVKSARWYIERVKGEVALAAVCWPATARELAAEKYEDVPAMEPWLVTALGDEPFVYLDEIFRDGSVRSKGNLANFGPMLTRFGALYGLSRVMYRSKQERLLAKTKAVFGADANIVSPAHGLPDWRGRSVAIINLKGQS